MPPPWVVRITQQQLKPFTLENGSSSSTAIYFSGFVKIEMKALIILYLCNHNILETHTHTHTQHKRILFTFKRTDCSLGSWPLSIGNHSTLSPDNSKGNGITVIKTEKRNSTTAGRRNIPQRQFCSDTLKFKWFKCTVAAQELLNNIYKISSSNGRKPEME